MTTWLTWTARRPSPAFQGIDHLELVLLPPDKPVTATLVVHMQHTWDETKKFSAASFRLTGGLRIRDIALTYKREVSADMIVELELAAVGDASEYTLTLVGGGDKPIHPFFASAAFVFTLNCDLSDCRPLAEPAPRVLRPRPAIDLLTKDYDGFVQMFGDWVRVHNPSWADLSPASLERVLVELLAHHGDLLSYYQDRVGNEAFVDTASQRYSLRQHAALLGTSLFDGAAAETLLAFAWNHDGYVPAGVEVTTPAGAGAEVVFWVVERTRVLAAHSVLPVAAWPGAADATIPAGADEVLLWGKIADLAVGQRLAFVQGDFEAAVPPAVAVPPAHVVTITGCRHVEAIGWTASPSESPAAAPVPLTVVTFDPPLTAAVRPAWGREDALRIHGNLARARFGRAKLDEVPRSEAHLARDRQSFVLERRPGFSHPLLRALRLEASPVVFEAKTTAAGLTVTSVDVDLRIDGERWRQVAHLHGSQSFERHFVASADEDGSLWIEFGDGEQGRAVEVYPEDELRAAEADKRAIEDIEVRYRIGDPVAGNIGAGSLTRFVPGQAALAGFVGLSAVNVAPGTGGRRPETKEAVRLRIPASLRHGPIERAVTLADYAAAARTVEGVGRAAAKLLGGPFNAVLVLVDPAGQAGLDEAMRARVFERIDALRMTGREHFVSAAEYVPIDVCLGICAAPGSLPHCVRAAVLAALRPGDGRSPGYFHPDRLSFSEALELGELLAVVQRIPGVRAVKALRFRRLREPPGVDVVPRIVLAPTEIARMDGDDAVPDHGRLKVLVVGLDAGVTEKNFVIEEVAS